MGDSLNHKDSANLPAKKTRRHVADAVSLSANMEDYLEAIYNLANENEGRCRVSQIAEALAVKKPSVSKALKRLKNLGFVLHSRYGDVEITEKGKQVAERQVRNHKILIRFMTEILKLPAELAEHDACLMEHAISPETVDRLVEFVAHLETQGVEVSPFKNILKLDESRKEALEDNNRTWVSRV